MSSTPMPKLCFGSGSAALFFSKLIMATEARHFSPGKTPYSSSRVVKRMSGPLKAWMLMLRSGP